AILDWMMPGLDGVEICRRLRAVEDAKQAYLILLTARQGRESIVAGLESGADDFVSKPFDPAELQARLQVGLRVLDLESKLADRVRELEAALAGVKQLQGLLPICAWCKKIRDDQNYWQQVDTYIAAHTEARFSHGICPDCMKDVLRSQLEKRHGPPKAT